MLNAFFASVNRRATIEVQEVSSPSPIIRASSHQSHALNLPTVRDLIPYNTDILQFNTIVFNDTDSSNDWSTFVGQRNWSSHKIHVTMWKMQSRWSTYRKNFSQV